MFSHFSPMDHLQNSHAWFEKRSMVLHCILLRMEKIRDRIRIESVAKLKIWICWLVKQKHFIHYKNTKYKAQKNTRIWTLSHLSIPLSQFPNKFVTFFGRDMLKVIRTMHHKIFEKGQSINICSIVSSLSQNNISYHDVNFS